MIKSKAIVLALLALALGMQAGAVTVTSSEAALAAQAWMRRGSNLGFRAGAIERTSELALPGEGRVYAVKVKDGGTVLVSDDTDREPIIAFTSSPVDFPSIPAGSPLAALLSRDQALRRRAAEVSVADRPSVRAARRRWASLLDQADGSAAPLRGEDSPDDLRVAPLVETQWGQEEMAIEGGEETASCFNYRTPYGYPCGCVATALAQVMRYHLSPVEAVEVFSNKCTVTGWSMWLETSGVAYDWANMPARELSADAGVREAQCEAIGQLTYECGIAVQMDYSSDGSGAMTEDVAGALKSRFGYAQAIWSGDQTGLSYDESVREKLLYASIDAGSPVILSIRGAGGHAVVGDGYGYGTIDGEKVPYVHLNMGWIGENDWWYNLPEINCADNPEDFAGFDIVAGAVYGIFPGRTGRIVSGRVLAADGEPVAGVEVRMEGLAATTDANGIYRFVVSEDELTNGIYRAESADAGRSNLGEIFVSLGSDNSWGNEIMLMPPAVTLNGSEKFATLDRALAVASEGFAEASSFVISGSAGFNEPEWRFGYDAEFTGGTTDDRIVRTRNGVLIAEADSALTFQNIAVTGGEGPSVRIESGAKAVLLGSVDLGEVILMEGGVLDLGEFDGSHALVVDTPGRATEGAELCRFAGDATAMSAFAGLVVCKTDESLAAEFVDRGGGFVAMIWAHVDSVHELASVASVVQDGETAHYRSLGSAFRAIRGDAEVIVRKDCTLGDDDSLTVSGAVTVRADSPATVWVEPADPKTTRATCVFTVQTNCTLAVSNVCFYGFALANAFASVNGGVFVLDDEAALAGISSYDKNRSPVTVDYGGRFVMRGGSSVFDCSSARGNGGAVRLVRAGCTMEIESADVFGCSAQGYGGGVYVANGAEIRVSTGAWICGNTVKGADNDVYLAGTKAALTVAGVLTDWGSIGVSGGQKTTLDPGVQFAKLADGLVLNAHELESTAEAFMNEGEAPLAAAANEAGDGFVWTESKYGEHFPLDPSEWDGEFAFAKVIYPDGTEEQWEATQWALESLLTCDPGSEATVVLLQDDWFDENIVISNRVTLTSEPSDWFLERVPSATSAVLLRGQGCDITVAAGADLTITNLMMGGLAMLDDGPSGSLIKVNGGAITLGDGTYIGSVWGSGSRAAGAVVVWNDGSFTMLPGSCIDNCYNDYVNVAEGTGVGAGVLVDDGEAYLYGGTVRRCTAYKGAGIFIGNKANVHLKGDFCAYGNTDLKGNPSNLYVSDLSDLILEDPLDFSLQQFYYGIGYTEGVRGDPVVFGRLAETYSGSEETAAQDADLFVHDLTGDHGVLVTGDAGSLLIWSRGLAADGSYTDAEGNVYQMADKGYDTPVLMPTPVPLVYNGSAQVGVPEAAGYTVTGNVATNAGVYTAVVTLKPGCVWDDSWTTEPREVEWTIAKAVYDMSGVTFEDKTYMAIGVEQSLWISGLLPPGVVVSYEGNGQVGPGTFTVTAKFTGDAGNYEPIPDMTAVLTIGSGENPEPPPPGPVTVHPTPIAFESIERTAEGEWTLVVTNIVPYCNYRLLRTADLADGFTVTGAWVQAAADAPAAWTNVVTTADDARFWRAEAKDGEKPASN